MAETNETKWTPGPYKAKRSRNRPTEVVASGGAVLAQCYGLDTRTAELPDVPMHANADLFAAAPDLYEALSALVSQYRPDYHYFEECEEGERCVCVYGEARAALARARGEE